jgi:hypothetical protein
MKKLTVQFVAVFALLTASLFYASAQTGGPSKKATAKPKPTTHIKACCNQTSSGGLTGCNKPMSDGTCPSKMVKAKCSGTDSSGAPSNCTAE